MGKGDLGNQHYFTNKIIHAVLSKLEQMDQKLNVLVEHLCPGSVTYVVRDDGSYTVIPMTSTPMPTEEDK